MFFGRRLVSCGMAVMLATASVSALAADHVVNAQLTSWDPMIVYVQSGDTVKWENMAGHNSESIDGMIPEGAEKWASVLGEAASHTFKDPGAYIYKCAPHYSTGMVGVVVVGDGRPANIDAIKNHPDNKGMIARTIRKLLKDLEAKGMQ